MELNTKYFGKIPYQNEEIIHINDGLYGFENYHSYLLIRFEPDSDASLCLQCIDEPNLAFILMNPFSLLPQYAPLLTEEDLKDLKIDTDNKQVGLLYYAICVLHDKMEESTVNLKCPLVVNPENNLAKQLILDNNDYTFKHPLKEFEKKGEPAC